MKLNNYGLYLQNLNQLERNEGRVIEERRDLFEELSDQRRFRSRKETESYILDIIGEQLELPTGKNYPTSPRNRLLIALRFNASGTFQGVIGDVCDVDRTTACRIIHKVSDVGLIIATVH